MSINSHLHPQIDLSLNTHQKVGSHFLPPGPLSFFPRFDMLILRSPLFSPRVIDTSELCMTRTHKTDGIRIGLKGEEERRRKKQII